MPHPARSADPKNRVPEKKAGQNASAPARAAAGACGAAASSSGLTKDEINCLPIGAFEGEIVLVRNEAELDDALAELRKEAVLGFDTETRPNFFRGKVFSPTLIQLAGAKRVFLIQLIHIPFCEKAAALLADENVLKAGVGIRDDMRALAKLHPFEAGGAVDLAVMARSKGIKAQGLRTLAANLLGFRISKGAQCTNWENPDLTLRQVKYAATDAWVGRELYLTMISGYKSS